MRKLIWANFAQAALAGRVAREGDYPEAHAEAAAKVADAMLKEYEARWPEAPLLRDPNYDDAGETYQSDTAPFICGDRDPG